MILIDNVDFLRKYDRDLLERMKKMEEGRKGSEHEGDDATISLTASKSGVSTLLIKQEQRTQYIHSKYDPLQEAERLIENQQNAESYRHVFFYGVGLGYHIDHFLKKFPDMKFSIYEPNEMIFYHFLEHTNLQEWPVKNLKNLHVQSSAEDADDFLSRFVQSLTHEVLFMTLPSYERIFKEQFNTFSSRIKKAISGTRSNVRTNVAFQKRWTLNSMINFPQVLQTPNILEDVWKQSFEGKPALLVAAGPSLDEEIENIRYIKENGLAYVFSVGSAINTLIEHGIYPDAICSYDPTKKNLMVFKKLIDRGIHTIPLIYGSSIAFEVLQNYPGPKLYFPTSQDTVSAYFLADTDHLQVIHDAASIAVVTFQMLHKLGCNPIILVGQNLAYKGTQRYAQGIDYQAQRLSEEQLNQAIEVQSVDDETILTNESMNRMRQQLEMYARQFTDTTKINTTKGGAKISGTDYLPLEEVISRFLKEKVVEEQWFRESYTNADPNRRHVHQKFQQMDKHITEFERSMNQLKKQLNKIQNHVNDHKLKVLDQSFKSLDRCMRRVTNNPFFSVFLKPIVRVKYDLMAKTIQSVRFEKDILNKGSVIVQTVSQFIQECERDRQTVLPLYHQMKAEIFDMSVLERS